MMTSYCRSGGHSRALIQCRPYRIDESRDSSLGFTPDTLRRRRILQILYNCRSLITGSHIACLYCRCSNTGVVKQTNKDEMMNKLREYLPPITNWGGEMVSGRGKGVSFGQQTSEHVSVSKILDIEESIWSPRLGCKGKVDATVRIHPSKLLPLEVKSGAARNPMGSVDHRGQVIIYTMLLEERYKEAVQGGLLWYVKGQQTVGVASSRAERRALLMRRNEVAEALHSAVTSGQLPPVINNKMTCEYCSQQLACSASYKSQNTKEPPLPEILSSLTETLSTPDLEYFAKFVNLCIVEADAGKTRMPWDDSCPRSGELTLKSVTDGIHNFTGIIGERLFSKGDYVIVNLPNRSIYNIASGFVTGDVTHSSISVSLATDLSKSPHHRESACYYRITPHRSHSSLHIGLSNLTSLMGPSERVTKWRGLVVEGRKAVFREDGVDIQLPDSLNGDQRKVIERALVTEDYLCVQGITEGYTKVLTCETAEKGTIELRVTGEWFYCSFTVGMRMNVIGLPVDRVIDNDSDALIITHPDVLVSPTTVSSSIRCLRQSVLTELDTDLPGKTLSSEHPGKSGSHCSNFIYLVSADLILQVFKHGSGEANEVMLRGTLIHSILERALQTQDFSPTFLLSECKSALDSREIIENLCSLGLSKDEMINKLREYLPLITNWGGEMVSGRGKGVSFGQQTSEHVSVSKILDIEESIWSPRLGCKGKVDATVRIHPSKLLPLEVKSGAARNPMGSVDHRGQVIIYTMLLEERYKEAVQGGLLWYVKGQQTVGVASSRAERRALLMRRNEVAEALHSAVTSGQLPPVINNKMTCEYCSQQLACSASYKSQKTKDPPLPEILSSLTETLSTPDLEYFSKFVNLCIVEADAGKTRMPWDDSCPRSGELTLKSVTDGIHNFTGIIGERLFSKGDYVIVNLPNRSIYNIASGFVTGDVTPSNISVSLATNISKSPHHRESACYYRITPHRSHSSLHIGLSNLTSLMGPSERVTKWRGLVVEGRKAVFREDGVDIQLPDSLNGDQRMVIERALVTEDYLCVQGMPGTGKTTTVACLVEVLVAQGYSVLLTAYTHTAVDNILLKLPSTLPVLRLGASGKVHKNVRHMTDSALTSGISDPLELREFYKNIKVVASTCLGIRHRLFELRSFDYCIIDEASQITQPISLGPLIHSDRGAPLVTKRPSRTLTRGYFVTKGRPGGSNLFLVLRGKGMDRKRSIMMKTRERAKVLYKSRDRNNPCVLVTTRNAYSPGARSITHYNDRWHQQIVANTAIIFTNVKGGLEHNKLRALSTTRSPPIFCMKGCASHVTETERERRARVLEHAARSRSLLEHAPKREHKHRVPWNILAPNPQPGLNYRGTANSRFRLTAEISNFLDKESALCRLFRHRVLLEFRLIWALYLKLTLECSTRVRLPFKVRVAHRVFSQNLVDERGVPSGPLVRYRKFPILSRSLVMTKYVHYFNFHKHALQKNRQKIAGVPNFGVSTLSVMRDGGGGAHIMSHIP
eukprot:sb/3460868/